MTINVRNITQLDKYGRKACKLILDGRNLFITGKAGTGKSTVLKVVVEEAKANHKKVIVAAPTGVAARVAKGSTLHSLLHLPLGPYIPGMKVQNLYSLDDTQKDVVRQLDILFIDEVSMVRCDLLDKIDDVLRHYRGNDLPFGGIQIVMFGDLYQLMPVATDEDQEKLKKVYKSMYFFSAHVLQKLDCPIFELMEVHRQTNGDFKTLLNNVREGKVSYTEMKMIESRYKENFLAPDSEKYIRLTTHNYRAKKFNQERLDELPGEVYEYKAYIKDYVPKDEWPTDYVLSLKRGSRVMFIRNDNKPKQYVNGNQGTVVRLREHSIVVKTDDGPVINVEQQTWDYYNYKVNKQKKKIEAQLLGSFRQYPLKLAWAVTIHKSQGMQFRKVIIDAGRAFAYGQVYVALSRCETFHGIVLVSKINDKIIKTDPVVVKYMQSAERIWFKEEEPSEVVDDDEEEQSIREHVHFNSSVEKTLWMGKDRLTLEQMVNQSGERIEIICSHLAKLVESGEADVHDYISDKKYIAARKAIVQLGTDARPLEIRDLCLIGTTFGEINLVKASILHGDPELSGIRQKNSQTYDRFRMKRPEIVNNKKDLRKSGLSRMLEKKP